MSDFIIGTANFTQPYGSGNSPLEQTEIISILECALNFGIRDLDTAENYGSLEKIIPKTLLDQFRVRTKIVIKNDSVIIRECDSILEKFKTVKAVLIHNAEEISLDALSESLAIMKANLNGSHAGVSIYNKTEILNESNIDAVQLPFNILNDPLKLIPSNVYEDLDIIVRSVFLQGVLLKKRIPKENPQLTLIREYINLLARAHEMTATEFLLASVKSKNLTPVLGFRNFAQFKEILSMYINLPLIKSEFRIVTQPSIFDPRQWK